MNLISDLLHGEPKSPRMSKCSYKLPKAPASASSESQCLGSRQIPSCQSDERGEWTSGSLSSSISLQKPVEAGSRSKSGVPLRCNMDRKGSVGSGGLMSPSEGSCSTPLVLATRNTSGTISDSDKEGDDVDQSDEVSPTHLPSLGCLSLSAQCFKVQKICLKHTCTVCPSVYMHLTQRFRSPWGAWCKTLF